VEDVMAKRSSRPPLITFELDIDEPVTVSFKIHRSLLKVIDDAVKRFKFTSRSEFIRNAIRFYLNELGVRYYEAPSIDLAREILSPLSDDIVLRSMVRKEKNR